MNRHPMSDPVGHMLALLQLGMCGRCGRARYETRRTARHAARIAAPGTRLRAYRCGTAWHLTSPNGRPQHITAPVTLPPSLGRGRARLDGRGRDERRYRRPGPDDRADRHGTADASGRRGSPDPLEETRDTDPPRPRRRSAGGGR
ncbi:hypothetical protein BJF79_43240 [Actinomadura sp. CNU-125]|uniref:hypothetical protein n=1 Tax=Actinomadura sp. CNU-125 TaxID=1904961 RepID=UPI000962DEA4|nr:hypothetical protein [Actinomadura sp. CNU-125]OLT26667.1 hypothetical protein BJF79_43240 [Actinomadura sp. CNU-125]